jgi:Tol biopolymer transport system component
LTTSGNAEQPAISPDGKYVAYVQHDGNDYSLWIKQIATASNVQIVRPESGVTLRGPTVTPDGSFVDFVRNVGGGPSELWRIPFLGGTPRKLVENINSLGGWSPDGQHLAFVRGGATQSTSELIVADADGSHERVLAARRKPAKIIGLTNFTRPILRPAWSPDGRLVASVGENQSGMNEVVLVDVASGSERTIPIPDVDFNSLAWLDRTSLVLNTATNVGAPRQLWRLSYPAGQLARLTNDVNEYAGVSVTADAGGLVTARSEKRVVMWVGNGGATDGTEVVPPVDGGNPQKVAWAGERLLYSANTGQPTIVRFTPGRGTAEVIVPQGGSPAATSDGRTIVFDSFERGARAGVWKADVDGRHAVQLVPDIVSSPVVTGDDRYVIFISVRSGMQAPWIVPIDGGSPMLLIDRTASNSDVAVSADGRSFAFVALDKNLRELVVCDLPACKAPRSFAMSRSSPIRWMPDDRGVAYIDATQSNLWVQPFDGKPPYQLTHFTDRVIEDFAWSHDGKRLAIVRTTTTNDIVLFKGLRR